MMSGKNKMSLNIIIDFVMLMAMALVSISGFAFCGVQLASLFHGTSGGIYCSDRIYTWQGFHASHSVGKTSSSLNPRLR